MAKKIVGMLQPFDSTQTIYVYEGNNKIDAVETTLDDFTSTVLGLAEKYKITDINIAGPKKYTKGIGDKIKEKGLTSYNNNQLTIKYL